MSESNFKWYVLRAVSGKEAKVKEYIEAEVRNGTLSSFVSQVLIPTEKVVTQKNGKRVKKDRNYLPGYVLVEAVLNGEVSSYIRDIPNVIGFLGTSDTKQPIPIREQEVKRILGTVDQLHESEEDFDVTYSVGEIVKVTDGSLNGLTGEIFEVNNERKKVKVMVKIFGRELTVELGFMQVIRE